MKASAFRRWPVAGAYSPEQTTRLTGGSDYAIIEIKVLRCDFLRKNRKGIIVKVYKKTS